MTITGVDIIDRTTFVVVPGTPFNYEWEEHGLELFVPQDALDPKTPPLTFSITATVSGQYELPDGMSLVSGVYWIAPTRNFSQKVTLKLQHCASIKHPGQLKSLSFVTANGSQKTLPYEFLEIPGGVFPIEDNTASIQLSHFSGFAVTRRSHKKNELTFLSRVMEWGYKWWYGEFEEEEEEEDRIYVVRTYSFPQGANNWLIHVVIVWDLSTCLQVCYHGTRTVLP